jgi:hypothetical protein
MHNEHILLLALQGWIPLRHKKDHTFCFRRIGEKPELIYNGWISPTVRVMDKEWIRKDLTDDVALLEFRYEKCSWDKVEEVFLEEFLKLSISNDTGKV